MRLQLFVVHIQLIKPNFLRLPLFCCTAHALLVFPHVGEVKLILVLTCFDLALVPILQILLVVGLG